MDWTSALARVLVSHRSAVYGGAVLLTALAVWGHQIDLGPKGLWRDSNDPDQSLLQEVTNDFALVATDTFLVVEPDDLFNAATVTALREMVSGIEALPQVKSLVWVDQAPVLNVFGLAEPLLPEADASPDAFRMARQVVLNHPLVVGQLISSSGEMLLMPITLDWLEVESDEAGNRAILDAAHAVLARHPDSHCRVRLTGRVPVFIAQRDAFQRNHRKFQIIGYGLVFALSAALFRSIVPILIVAGVPSLGVYWVTGLLPLLQIEANALTSIILPVLLTMIGLTDGVHLFVQIRTARANGESATSAAQIGIQRVGLACFLTSVTTAVGFGSLLLAHSEFVRSFGQACGIGVLIQFVAVITLIPLLCASRLGNHIQRGHQRDYVAAQLQRAGWLIRFSTQYARPVIWFAVVISLGLALFASTLRPDDRTEYSLSARSDVLRTIRDCDAAFGGTEVIRVSVQWPESLGSESPQIMRVVQEVERILDAEPMVRHPLSIRNLLASFPGDLELPQRMSFLQLLPTSLKDSYFNAQAHRTIINVRVQDVGIAVYIPIFEGLEAQFRELEQQQQGFDVRLTGGPVVRGRQLHRIVTDLAASLGAASIIIFGVLSLAYRSLRVGLITIIPNLFPLLVTAAILVLMGQSLDMASVCAFTVCLGIAVDDTIHFLSRFFDEQRRGASVDQALKQTFFSVGAALIQTTLILIAGFMAVVTSELPGQRTFAAMACSTIAAALIGDLVFLPALLTWFAPNSENRALDLSRD